MTNSLRNLNKLCRELVKLLQVWEGKSIQRSIVKAVGHCANTRNKPQVPSAPRQQQLQGYQRLYLQGADPWKRRPHLRSSRPTNNSLRLDHTAGLRQDRALTFYHGAQPQICGVARLGTSPRLMRSSLTSNPYQDSAPDIYETPELTDDNSTVPVTARASFSFVSSWLTTGIDDCSSDAFRR